MRLVLLLLVVLLANATLAAERPNVVLILIDDLGRNDLGCYGSTYYRTPRIDELARKSMRFTHAYAACPVCSPTRASILTGKHPARLHLTDWLPGRRDRSDQMLLQPKIHQQLPLEEITLAERLAADGYATGIFGKWHLGGEGFEPQRQGFQRNVGGDHSGTPLRYFAPFRERDGRSMPGLDHAKDGEYLTDRLTTEVLNFIADNRQQPFFVYLPHYAVHTPIRAKEEYVATYQALPPGQQNNPVYAAMIQSVDESVGRIIDGLREMQLDQRTIIIFTSDNGGLSVVEGPRTPSTINAPLREGKGYVYEGGIRVPLIVHWPGVIQAGSTTNSAVSSVDLYSTVLEMCGCADADSIDGTSYAPLLRGGAWQREDDLFWHYPHYSNQGGRPSAAIRSGDFKLVEFYEDGRRELFNVAVDEGEHRNLIEQEPEIAERLAARLNEWRAMVDAQMLVPNPDFIPNPPGDDGSIQLHASTARIHGIQLRYEPLPHKNTLGYWTEDGDWASWEFTVQQPGDFRVTMLQGCGAGQGGSIVELRVANQSLEMTVEDTGHFQNFKEREMGTLKIDAAGRYTCELRVKQKAAQAVMDVRSISLVPAN